METIIETEQEIVQDITDNVSQLAQSNFSDIETKHEDTQPTADESQPILEPKMQVIIGIDPAFKKTGIAVIDEQTGKYIDSFQTSLKPDKKMTQTESDGYLANNAETLINMLFDKYDVLYVVIELQLGQFSADRVQLAFVQALPQNVKYVIQHSKLKLKHPQIKSIQADNPDSNKYNQNKHQGRQLAQQLFPEVAKLTFDEYDSLLHAYYAFSNKTRILWHSKQNLI